MRARSASPFLAVLVFVAAALFLALRADAPERLAYYLVTGSFNPSKTMSGPAVSAQLFKMLYSCRFDEASVLKLWDEKVFHGKTAYTIEAAPNGDKALRIHSSAAASALYHKVEAPVKASPVIEWTWRATVFPGPAEGRALSSRDSNDFAARLYVIFRGPSIMSSDIIEYVWDHGAAEGTVCDSPYAKRSKILVVRHDPPPADGSWVTEKRDIRADYRALFGKALTEDVVALAFMSDSDNTRAESEVFIQSIQIKVPEHG